MCKTTNFYRYKKIRFSARSLQTTGPREKIQTPQIVLTIGHVHEYNTIFRIPPPPLLPSVVLTKIFRTSGTRPEGEIMIFGKQIAGQRRSFVDTSHLFGVDYEFIAVNENQIYFENAVVAANGCRRRNVRALLCTTPLQQQRFTETSCLLLLLLCVPG